MRKPVAVAYGRGGCGRCGADLHAPDPPHICKDILLRQKRQERYIRIVEDTVHAHWTHSGGAARLIAEDVVKRLLNAGIEGEP